MSEIVEVVVGAIVVAVLGFFVCVLGTLSGALVGWVISVTPLHATVVNGFAVFGIDAAGKLVQIGAMCGFVGGFFTSSGGSSSS